MVVAYCEECGKKVALKKSGACSLCGHQIIEQEKKKGLSGVEILLGLALGVGGIYIAHTFNSTEDESRRIAQAEQRSTEQQQREQAKEAAAREARRAEATAKQEADAAACAKSIRCQAEKHSSLAEVYCPQRVERYAKHDVKWTDDGFLEGKFTQFRVKDEQNGIVTYLGDKVKFQNGFGAWTNIIYSCDINIKTEKVLAVNVTEGRL